MAKFHVLGHVPVAEGAQWVTGSEGIIQPNPADTRFALLSPMALFLAHWNVRAWQVRGEVSFGGAGGRVARMEVNQTVFNGAGSGDPITTVLEDEESLLLFPGRGIEVAGSDLATTATNEDGTPYGAIGPGWQFLSLFGWPFPREDRLTEWQYEEFATLCAWRWPIEWMEEGDLGDVAIGQTKWQSGDPERPFFGEVEFHPVPAAEGILETAEGSLRIEPFLWWAWANPDGSEPTFSESTGERI